MVDLRYSNLRILIESTSGNTLDVAPFLVENQSVQIARGEPNANTPVTSAVRFTIAKAYSDNRTTESFDKDVNSRFRPGSKVVIQIYFSGAWRDLPFGGTTYIKYSFLEDTFTHQTCEIEAQGKLSQVIEEDKAFSPERLFDSAGNPVAETREVLGSSRTLEEIVNSYLHVKGVGPVVGASGFMQQSTLARKEYLQDTADSEINNAQQMVWYNPDRADELNFLYENYLGETAVASIPLTLSLVTPTRKLFDATWGPYSESLIKYYPEKNVEQLPEYIFVSGTASKAKQRPSVTTDGRVPPQSKSFSFNVPVNPITSTVTTTTMNWPGRTIETEVLTYSTAAAVKVTKGASAGFGNVLVQREVTKKFFDTKRRLYKEMVERFVPDSLKLGTGSSSSISGPAYRKETLYDLDNADRVINEITNETAANAVTGTDGVPEELGLVQVKGKFYNKQGGRVSIASASSVMSPPLAQGNIPYFPGSYAGQDDRANAPQCEYMPDEWYVENTPIWRKVQLTWATGTATKRIKEISVGSALLTGANFDFLATSLARLTSARHSQYNCEFPLSIDLFTKWRTPGKVISISVTQDNVKKHFFTGADSIEISSTGVICKTALFLIATENITTGATSAVIPAIETFYLLDENDNIWTDENDDPIEWL